MRASKSFWDQISRAAFTNEASVETGLVLPLLRSLGYDEIEHISPKHSIEFREGRRGRKPEADFVVFAEKPHTKATSLIVVEAKRPDEALSDGQAQAESYAGNIKAPLFLTTNGERLEIWQYQTTAESERLLECSVKELSAKRGIIEALLTREAAISHSRTLAFKNFNLLARDLSAYEQAEFEREPSTSDLIPRRLKDPASKKEVLSDILLEAYQAGAVIAGPSGYGKTSLSSQMRCQAVERRWMGGYERLPIEVFLPDAPVGQSDFRRFLLERIAAHCPHMTDAAFQDLLRKEGVILLCDGFERVPPASRSTLARALANFRRDFPKCQLFLFTRPSTLPERLGLTSLEMCDLNREEQDALIRKFWEVQSHRYPSTRDAAGDFLKSLWKYPLLLRLTLETHQQNGRLPNDIATLFRHWLDRIIPASMPIKKRVEMREILTIVAKETVSSPLSEAALVSLAENYSEDALQQLVDNDAFSKRGDMLEVRHEALADYLRALEMLQLSPEQIGERIEEVSFVADSQFAHLLMAMAQSVEVQGIVWRKVAAQNLSAAISSLRYRADVSGSFDTDATQRSLRFLSDIMDGIRVPLQSHFGSFSREICSCLAGQVATCIAIEGELRDNEEGVEFAFFPSDFWQEAPAIGKPSSGRRFYHSLKLGGLRLDSGRLLGMMRLRDAIVDLVAKRQLKGGLVWAEERTVSRLRHLVKRYRFPDVAGNSLAAAIAMLEPYADQWVTDSSIRSGQRFAINDLVQDIRMLLDSSTTSLVPWWQPAYPIDVKSTAGQERLAGVLHEHFRRVQLAYHEVVDANFPALKASLRQSRVFPVRYEVEVELERTSPRGSPDIAGMDWRWLPVRTFEEVGADVAFIKGGSKITSSDEIERYEQRAQQRFVEVGRGASAGYFSWCNSARIPDFAGEIAYHGEELDETSVIRAVVGHLSEEIKSIFQQLPNTDHGYGQASPLRSQFRFHV